jgi:hypothetical protein
MASSKITVMVAALPEVLQLFRMAGVFVDGSAECNGGALELKISGPIVPSVPHVTAIVTHTQHTPDSYSAMLKFEPD